MKKSILSVAALATLLLLTRTASADRLGGDWALEFQVRPTFLGYNDPGVGIAAKHHFTRRSAVRVGTTYWTTSADQSSSEVDSRTSLYDTQTTAIAGTYNRQYRNITMFAHLVRDLGIGNRIAVFLEAGPLARRMVFADSRVDSFTSGTQQGTRTIWEDSRSWEYGGEAQGGFEWFVRNRLSVAARYGVWATWTRGDQSTVYTVTYGNDQDIDTRTSKNHSFNTGTSAATFSVIAYW